MIGVSVGVVWFYDAVVYAIAMYSVLTRDQYSNAKLSSKVTNDKQTNAHPSQNQHESQCFKNSILIRNVMPGRCVDFLWLLFLDVVEHDNYGLSHNGHGALHEACASAGLSCVLCAPRLLNFFSRF